MGKNYSIVTIESLFSLSGNKCTFPGCTTDLVDDNKIIIGEKGHIEGEKETSARYNPNMTEEQRKSIDNLILLCPTHHTLIDKNPVIYTTEWLKKVKIEHEKKNQNKLYQIPTDILKILKVSINNDEYSLERVHNLLRIYKKLIGKETKKLCNEYFRYALKSLTLPQHVSEDENEALKVLFDDLLELKSDQSIYPELILAFLEKIPSGVREQCMEQIRSDIKTITENDFANPHLPEFYLHLKRSDLETTKYLIDNAGKFDKQTFDNFLRRCKIDLGQLAKETKLFSDLERRLWEKLDHAEQQTQQEREEYNNVYENIKTLIHKFISTTS